MKVILSRKGFDSSNGGCPSPVLPDGTLLSMPIPSDHDPDMYEGLQYNEVKYSDILRQLSPSREYVHCHVDPDIREDVRVNKIPRWKPAFGQIGAAQGLLRNAGVEKGDLFLYFGWFRKTEYKNGKLTFIRDPKADMHVIYGYLEIGDILIRKKDIERYPWHPHANYTSDTNALYIPSKHLSFDKTRKGYGTLDYREDRVLTLERHNRGTWKELPFLMPEYVYGNKKNSSKGKGLYYSGIWQELVVYGSPGLIDWAEQVVM